MSYPWLARWKTYEMEREIWLEQFKRNQRYRTLCRCDQCLLRHRNSISLKTLKNHRLDPKLLTKMQLI